MNNITPEQLKQNRRTATLFGSVSIAGLIVLVYVLVNYFPNAEDTTFILAGLGYLLVWGILGGFWMRWWKRKHPLS